MLTQNVSFNLAHVLNATVTLGYFNTDDYDSRVYAYERGLLYSFYSPAYYGNGMRFAVVASSAFSDVITIAAKIGTTKYFDRDKIGNSYQQIDSSVATDLELQLNITM